MNQLTGLPAVLAGDHQLRLTIGTHLHFRVFVNVAVSVTGDGDRLLPGGNKGGDALYYNRRAEYGAIQNRTDGTVGGFPHLLQMVFIHSGGIGGDGGAFHRHAVFLSGISGIKGHLVVSLVAVFQAKSFCRPRYNRPQNGQPGRRRRQSECRNIQCRQPQIFPCIPRRRFPGKYP